MLENTILKSIKESNYLIKHKDSLKRRLLALIRFNLYLIDIASWSDISDDFKNHIILQMQTDSMDLAIQFSSKTIFSSLIKKIKLNESDELPGQTCSIILARIKVLKVIANIPSELSADNRSILVVRLRNLKDILSKLLNELENENN